MTVTKLQPRAAPASSKACGRVRNYAGEGALGGAAESMDRAASVSGQHRGAQAAVKLTDAKPQAVLSRKTAVLRHWRLLTGNRLRLEACGWSDDCGTGPCGSIRRAPTASGDRRSRGIRALADGMRAATAAGCMVDRQGGCRRRRALFAEPAAGLIQDDPYLAVGRKLKPEAPRLPTSGSPLHDLHVDQTVGERAQCGRLR